MNRISGTLIPVADSHNRRRRGSGLVRTVVVAVATLSILLICFAIYQYAQREDMAWTRRREPRLPPPPTAAAATPREASGSAAIGNVPIQGGEKVTLRFYEPAGTRARIQIDVTSWSPISGASDEYLLVEPDVRLRTSTGNAVRVTAREGLLEAPRQPGGRLEPRRGRLKGDVVILIDRLTEAQRAQLPMDRRNEPDLSELLRVTMDEILFDLEYAKVSVPGTLHLHGRDVDFLADGLEAQFNEMQSRLDSLRIRRGGRIELTGTDDALADALPGASRRSQQSMTVVEWIRRGLQARLGAANAVSTGGTSQQPPQAAEASPEQQPQGSVRYAPDGAPIFAAYSHDEAPSDRPPGRYFARFDGGVEVSQFTGDQVNSRLEAEQLEILRMFSQEDRRRMAARDTVQEARAEEPSSAPRDRLVVRWSGPLYVEALPEEDPRWTGDFTARITARGAPAHVIGGEGEASCAELRVDPQESRIWLMADADYPAQVRSGDRGIVTAQEIFVKRHEDALEIRVSGPGRLTRFDEGLIEVAGQDGAFEGGEGGTIQFAERLDVRGRFQTVSKISLNGLITTREQRVIDEAIFRGDARLRQDEASLRADLLRVFFAAVRSDGSQKIDKVEGRGHVTLAYGPDRLSSEKLEVTFSEDGQGRIIPVTAVACEEVVATADRRTIRAADSLMMDFEMVRRPPMPFDAVRANRQAIEAGIDPKTVDWEAKRAQQESAEYTRVGLKRLRAHGDVVVSDPAQSLDVAACSVDCYFLDGRDIDTALVRGDEKQPATVRLGAMSVTGKDIRINVPDEWAEVPGPGRMTFQARRDLDGRELDEPRPIAVTWTEWMKYRGRENRSVFEGSVHATSETTTFDADRLEIEFEPGGGASVASLDQDWWIFEDIVRRLARREAGGRSRSTDSPASRRPSQLLATGNVVAVTTEPDDQTGAVATRASLRGPRLSLNLREHVSKMLIEGAGSLLLENLQRPSSDGAEDARFSGQILSNVGNESLLRAEETSGPSVTLIEWDDLMWYDFSIEQTRFEGNTRLKHFSGAYAGAVIRVSAPASSGRRTFLTCDVLTGDFLERDARREPGRMGRLGAARLRQFRAMGHARLQDDAEGILLTADHIVYERDRSLLAVYGTDERKARIIVERPGELPQDIAATNFFYNLETRGIEAAAPTVRQR